MGIVTDVVLPEVTRLPAVSSLRSGMRVCFTGEAVVGGKPVPRSLLEERAALVGMQPVGSVTKKGCDLLVTADVASRSGKARKANDYGIPVITITDFVSEVGKDTAWQ